jgi:hypothetical protein
LKAIPNLSRILFGIHEDLRRLRLPPLSIETEKSAINHFIISALDARRNTKYFGQCGSYGEALLNCYLDLFITLTVLKTPREFEVKPGFLVYPVTGSVLEIDVMLEDFRLGFEFQGEHHYTEPKVQAKDAFKLTTFGNHRRILIPVNLVQLQTDELQSLILNSIKDFLGLHELLATKNPAKIARGSASQEQLSQFSKATQRIYLSRLLFDQSLSWLDIQAMGYISNMSHRSPISSSSPAPRQAQPAGDLNVDYIYHNLKYVKRARQQRLGA